MNQNDKGMKKLITVIAATLMLLAPCFGQDNEVKISKKEIQEAGKQARAAEKILRKQGFKSFELGNATANLENYFLKVGSGCGSIVGTSTACISENLAKLTALANAANEYAVLQGGTVRGRIVSSASSLSGAQVDNLVASFERLVEKDIRGELIPCAYFYKERGSMYSARAYCIIDEEAASKARRHAMELALAEHDLMARYGSMVSDWIDEGFNKAGAGSR